MNAFSREPIFQWLNKEIGDPANLNIVKRSNTIQIIVDKTYGFDISPPMTLGEARQSLSYSGTMVRVVLPDEVLAEAMYTQDGVPHFFPLQIGTEKPLFLFFGRIPQYVFDFNAGILIDYCLPPNSSDRISPDGRFYAFTDHVIGDPEITSVYILNLENGYVSVIDDFEFMGWAVEND